MPEFLIFSFLELLELPLRVDLFWGMNHSAVLANESKLNSIQWLAGSHIEHWETLLENFLALFIGLVRIPFVSNDSQTKVFSKSNGNIIVSDIAAIKVNCGEEWLAILESSNDEIVVVWILIVSLLVTDTSQVVGIVLDCEVNVIVVRLWFSGQFVHFTGDLLEVWILASCCQNDAFGQFLNSVDIGIFYLHINMYSRDRRMTVECRLRLLYLPGTWGQWWHLPQRLGWPRFQLGYFMSALSWLTFKSFLKKYQITILFNLNLCIYWSTLY